jgi:hypothetical protein
LAKSEHCQKASLPTKYATAPPAINGIGNRNIMLHELMPLQLRSRFREADM